MMAIFLLAGIIAIIIGYSLIKKGFKEEDTWIQAIYFFLGCIMEVIGLGFIFGAIIIYKS